MEALIEKRFLETQDKIKLEVHFEGRLTFVPELNWSAKMLQDGETNQLHKLYGSFQVPKIFIYFFLSVHCKFIDGFPSKE